MINGNPGNCQLEKAIHDCSLADLLYGCCQIASEPTSFVKPLLPVGAATKKGSKNEACVLLRDGATASCRNQDNFMVGRISVEESAGLEEFRIYAVLDGHGLGRFNMQKRDGDFYSDAAARLLLRNLADALNRKRFREMIARGNDADVHHFFEFLFCGIDSALKLPRGGSTLTLAVHDVSRNQVLTGYVGDSLGIFLMKSKSIHVPVKLTPEIHKPTNPRERRRLTEMGYGAFINSYGRLGPQVGAGVGLAVSRSLGDTSVVHYGKSALPDVNRWPLGGGKDFILLATDGLWDVLTDAQATEFLSSRLSNSKPGDSRILTIVARDLAEKVSHDYKKIFGVSDDVTVLIVDLRK